VLFYDWKNLKIGKRYKYKSIKKEKNKLFKKCFHFFSVNNLKNFNLLNNNIYVLKHLRKINK
jgi:hypothetical protein